MKQTPLFNCARVTTAIMSLCAGSALACQQGGGATSIFELPGLGGSGGQVNAINSTGQLTGSSFVTNDLASHAFFFGENVLIDIGTFGGNLSEGLAINNAGLIVGDADVDAFSFHAFSYDRTNLLDLGTLGGSSSIAVAVNDAGQIAGNSLTAGDGSQQAFLFQNGSITNLGDLGGGTSSAAAINQGGVVAGYAVNLAFEQHAVVWTNGSIVDLGTLGGSDARSFAINNSGVVIGESSTAAGETHGFVFSGGVMIDLGTFGGNFSTTRGINNAGLVVGNASTADGATHGFVYDGTVVDLGSLGGTDTEANGINNKGQIVGLSSLDDGTAHAFIRQNGVMSDLNDFLPANSGWELISADFVSDCSRIVGFGIFNTEFKVFVMDLGGVTNNPPVANAGPDQTVDCQAQANLDGSNSSDPDGDALTYQWSEGNVTLGTNATLSLSLPLGIHAITLLVTDTCGATSQATVQVTVVDTTAPVVNCPAPITLNIDLNCQATVPNVTSQIQATDNCASQNSLAVSQAPVAGTLIGLGQHSIVVTVTDPSGNSAGCSVVLNVVDSTAPVIVSGPAIPTLSAGAQCQAAVPSVVADIVATDNCTPANQLVITQSPAAGTLVGLGQHLIVVTVTDASGNSAAGSLSFTVADMTAPVISSVPASIILSAGANCSAAAPNVTASVVANDNCTPANQLSVSQSPAAGSSLSIGQHAITVTATDAAGNHASANVLVTVSDTAAPVIISVSGALTVAAGANCQAAVPNVIGSVVASDNCTPASQLTITQSPAAGTLLAAGQYSIVVTVTDAAGNHTVASVPLTVADVTAPIIQSVAANPNVLSPANNKLNPVTVSVSATDNCDASPISKITSVTCSETFALGDIAITGNLTVSLAASRNSMTTARVYTIHIQCTDASGNSSTGTVQVTVPKNGKK